MWILPKSLMSAFAPVTEALTSDSSECSQICAQSLMRRSKLSPAKTFLREWKTGNLTRLRSGAISNPSLGSSFLDWWTSSLAATRVSHSAQQAKDLEEKTQGTSGRLSQVAFKFYDPDCAFLRMWRDTLHSDSEKSLQTWKALVTKRRGEYSQRLNAAHRTSAKECLSWPSPVASEVRQGFQDRSRGMKGSQESLTTVVLKISGPADPDNHSTHGNRPESWLTPRANEPEADNNFVARNADRGEHCHVSLTSQAQGKLNPHWVETLMGLPVGWTMPSCASPVIIAQTNCGCSATESSQQQQH
jgi:hypothetical protein